MKTRVVWMLAAAMLAAGTAEAFDEKAWLLLGGGGSRYAMNELNDELRYVNTTSGTGSAQFPMLDQGAALSLAAGFDLSNHFTLGLGTDRMYASTEASDATGSTRYQFTAHTWRLFTEYPIVPLRHLRVRLGLGAGIVGESGKISFSSPGSTPTEPMKLRGWAPMFEGYAGGDAWMSDRVGLSAAFGYRYAKIDVLHTPRDEFGNTIEFYSHIDGTPVEVDYSGPYLRLGMKFVGRGVED